MRSCVSHAPATRENHDTLSAPAVEELAVRSWKKQLAGDSYRVSVWWGWGEAPFLCARPKYTLILGAENKQKKVQFGTALLAYVLRPLLICLYSFPVVSNTAGLTASDREPCGHTCMPLKSKREWSSSQTQIPGAGQGTLDMDLPPP